MLNLRDDCKFFKDYTKLTTSLGQMPSWKANSHLAGHKIDGFYESQMFITIFTRAWDWSLSLAM
jgi:hypothetical protein